MKAYVCYNKDKKIRAISSSGGIYPLLAQAILEEGGSVFAACYDDDLNVCHREITDMDGIILSQGSKYLESDLGRTFLMIRKRLDAAKRVLFVGTPCQCRGLLCYLGKQRTGLICVDFVCHGVPGRLAWQSYLGSLKRKHNIGTIHKVNMRSKESGWTDYGYSWEILYDEGQHRLEKQADNVYMAGFVHDLYLRPSCYSCKFKGVQRMTDITLGDYWGVWNIHPEMDDDQGTSLVMIHTDQGRILFESIANSLNCKHTEIDAAVRYNQSIIQSSALPKERRKFFEKMYYHQDFFLVVRNLFKKSYKTRIKEVIKKMKRR